MIAAVRTQMTRDQATTLLQVASAFDHRHVDDAVINAWWSVALEAHWDYQEAVAALRFHYANEVDRIMPGHITRRIKHLKRAPAPVAEVLGVLEAPVASAETRRAAMAFMARNIGKSVPAA